MTFVKALSGNSNVLGVRGSTAGKTVTITFESAATGTFTATATSGSPILTAVSSLAGLVVGSQITSTALGISSGTTILSLTANTVTLSATPSSPGAGGSVSYTTNNMPSVGNTIVGQMRMSGGGKLDTTVGSNGFTDPRGNAWQIDAQTNNSSGVNLAWVRCKIVSGYSDGDTVTATITVSAAYTSLNLIEDDETLTTVGTPYTVTHTSAATADSPAAFTPASPATKVFAGIVTGGTTGTAAVSLSGGTTGWTLRNGIGAASQNNGIVQLNTVTDGSATPALTWDWGPSSADTMLVIAYQGAAQNAPPIADAGPDQHAVIGNLVTLDGSGSSDPLGGSITSWAWTITDAPPGSTATLSAANTISPTITPDVVDAYTIQLVVESSEGFTSAADTMTLTAVAILTPPANPPSIVQWTGQQGIWGRIVQRRLDGSYA